MHLSGCSFQHWAFRRLISWLLLAHSEAALMLKALFVALSAMNQSLSLLLWGSLNRPALILCYIFLFKFNVGLNQSDRLNQVSSDLFKKYLIFSEHVPDSHLPFKLHLALDQVPNRLGLLKVDSFVEQSPSCELSLLCHAEVHPAQLLKKCIHDSFGAMKVKFE